MAASLGLAAAVALIAEPSRAPAQDKKDDKKEEKHYTTTEDQIQTADGVRLRAVFHKSKTGDGTSPVVVLLYPPGPDRDMTKPAGAWDGLINRLAETKHHVIQFDWRGHGKSTDITDPTLFWTNPYTGLWNDKYVAGARKKPLANTIAVKGTGIKPQYFPAYATDLAAIRLLIDKKNDAGELNSSSIFIIGAGDSAALGFLWMVSEWNRPQVHPLLGAGQMYKVVPTAGIVNDPEGGKDIAGAIWLSGSRPATSPPMTIKLFQSWSKNTLKLRDNNPMLFLYGEKDALAHEQARHVYRDVLIAQGDPQVGVKKLELTREWAVPGTNLQGLQLLGDNSKLGTEDTILKYIAAVEKDRSSVGRTVRNYAAPYFVDLRYFGINP